MMRLRMILLAILALALGGCAVVRNVTLEARCGPGRDYVCGPTAPAGPWACGCLPKHWTERGRR
jgi:uncharacterized protein YceK